eukprot:TRINITY_DN29053_c0_g1_i1.p1 TRINITY_DN29053_c0_g1~~TRINITY_DN29053_c0_g1_i1.p1  ORF type:complete len:996 (-),score=200.92 TRINITY_DN29053_c0_g1_i1:43-3030(-)
MTPYAENSVRRRAGQEKPAQVRDAVAWSSPAVSPMYRFPQRPRVTMVHEMPERSRALASPHMLRSHSVPAMGTHMSPHGASSPGGSSARSRNRVRHDSFPADSLSIRNGVNGLDTVSRPGINAGGVGTGYNIRYNPVTPSSTVSFHSESTRTSLTEASPTDRLGLQPFPCAVIECCGSVENAWARIDMVGTGSVGRLAWDAAFAGIGIDVEQMCGVPAHKYFLGISAGSGAVSRSDWDHFFEVFAEDPENRKLLEAAARRYGQRQLELNQNQAKKEHSTPNTQRSSSLHAPRSRRPPAERRLSTIAEVLEEEALMSPEELQEKELQASAEQEQLQEELAKLELHGVEALAYVLGEKLASLKKAFQWFDGSKTDRIPTVEWDTGIRVLRIDLKKLTGYDMRQLFQMMEDPAAKGYVTKNSWGGFFEGISTPARKHGPSLAERAQGKKEQLRAQAQTKADRTDAESTGLKDSHVASDVCEDSSVHSSTATESNTRVAAATSERRTQPRTKADSNGFGPEEQRSFRQRIRLDLLKLAAGEVTEYSGDDMPELDEARLSIIEEVAAELGMYAHVLNKVTSKAGPIGILVFNLAEFAEETQAKLRGILPDASLAFPASLTPVMRQLVHLLATSLGLWTTSEGKGTERHITVYNVGDFAVRTRKRLESLPHGESAEFPLNLTDTQAKIVRMISAELKLWCYEEGEGKTRHIEVFNLNDFAERVRAELKALKPDMQKTFESSLKEKERKVVLLVCDELGLAVISQGDGSDRSVCVANLRDFRKQVRAELLALKPGETKIFVKTLSAMHRKAVHELATELGMSHVSQGVGPERYISVTLPKDFEQAARDSWRSKWRQDIEVVVDGLDKKGKRANSRRSAEAHRDTEVQSDDEEEDSDSKKFKQLFDMYATGHFKNVKLFLRSPDLDEFVEDVAELRSDLRQRFKRTKATFSEVYERTAHLQVDFGTRTNKGLTLRWFRTFVQKVARKAGLSATGLVLALLKEE